MKPKLNHRPDLLIRYHRFLVGKFKSGLSSWSWGTVVFAMFTGSFPYPAMAACSYDLNGVGYDCPSSSYTAPSQPAYNANYYYQQQMLMRQRMIQQQQYYQQQQIQQQQQQLLQQQQAEQQKAQEEAAQQEAARKAQFMMDRDATAASLKGGFDDASGSGLKSGTDATLPALKTGQDTEYGSDVVDLRGTTRDAPRLLRSPDHDAPPAKPVARIAPALLTQAQIHAQIKQIEDALRRLNASQHMDAEQRAEWLKESADATQDAYKIGASSVLDLAGHLVGDKLKKVDAQLEEGGSPKVIAQLKAQKSKLDRAKDAIDKGDDLLSLHDKLDELGKDDKSYVEKAYDLMDKAEVLPPGTTQAKTIIDTSYAITQQAISVHRINQLNNNADQYLKAVNTLSARMKTLVKLDKAISAQRSP